MIAGTLLLRAAAQAGYYGMMTQLFGAQVCGGNAAASLQILAKSVECQMDRFDLFVALDWQKIDSFAPKIPLDEYSIIIADPDAGKVGAGIAKSKAKTVAVAMGDAKATTQSMIGSRYRRNASQLVACSARA
jgi:2-oxoglutarate ferredoxin oxidoreductase subunit alpha